MKNLIMNGIISYLNEYGCVSLAKQCKNEYITYSFYQNSDKTTIVSEFKHHISNDGKNVKCRKRIINIPIKKFINDVLYDLLNRGYKFKI